MTTAPGRNRRCPCCNSSQHMRINVTTRTMRCTKCKVVVPLPPRFENYNIAKSVMENV